MKAPELVLSYDDGRWRVCGAGIELAHAELRALDRLIAAELACERTSLRVHVRFDVATLPHWLRQYQAHYCNYVLELPARSSSS